MILHIFLSENVVSPSSAYRMLLQALKAEADASQSKLDRAAEARRSLQAEVERLRKAHKSEGSAAFAVLEEKEAWIAKTKAKEEVGDLGTPTCLYHARTRSQWPCEWPGIQSDSWGYEARCIFQDSFEKSFRKTACSPCAPQLLEGGLPR